jgi:hypothetical protein
VVGDPSLWALGFVLLLHSAGCYFTVHMHGIYRSDTIEKRADLSRIVDDRKAEERAPDNRECWEGITQI